MSYSTRDIYLFSNNKCVSNIIQDTEVEAIFVEEGEETMQELLLPTDHTGNVQKNQGEALPRDEVGHIEQNITPFSNRKSKVDFSLGFTFPGECSCLRKDIQKIFDEEYFEACRRSKEFQKCFRECRFLALFKNEKSLGSLISKTLL